MREKTLPAAALLAAFFIVSEALSAQTVTLPVPELKTTAILTFEHADDNTDSYKAVTVDCLGHHERFLRKPDNATVRVPPTTAKSAATGVSSSIAGLRVSPSHLFFTTLPGDRTLVFLLSAGGASDAAPLYVLGFRGDGTPYRVLVRDQFDPTRVGTGPGSADILIIGKSSLSQIMCGEGYEGDPEPYATTYDPYSVYILHGEGPATYSLPISRAYNERHYVWHGPQVSESYSVLYNIPGRRNPFGASASRVGAIMDAAKKAGQKH